MAVLTIKLSTEQRDAIASAVRFNLQECTYALEDETPENSTYVATLREALIELTDRARDYSAETGLVGRLQQTNGGI